MALSIQVKEKISQAVGKEIVSDADFILHSYAKSLDHTTEPMRPALVVRPRSALQVSEVLKVANECEVPVIPRGGGTSLTQGVRPIKEGCIVMDLLGLDQIESIDLKAGVATVGTGCSWGKLDGALRKHGFYIGQGGPAAGSSSSIGGGLSCNSLGGGGGFKYGCASESCVGLEVVLPTGEIITTGSQASTFVKKPFKRYGLGPDFTGLFLGDPGTLGIKTKAMIKVYPKPPYYECKTLSVPGGIDNVAQILAHWSHGGYGLWDVQYLPGDFINFMGAVDIYKPFLNAQEGVLLYVAEAFTEGALEANVAALDEIASSFEAEPYGPSVEEGNMAKFYYEKHGYWNYGHSFFGILGPGSSVQVVVIDQSLEQLAPTLKKLSSFYEKNIHRFIEAQVGFGYAITLMPSGAKVAMGLPAERTDEMMAVRRQLYQDLLRFSIKECGGVPPWSEMAFGRALVEEGAYTPQHYSFMKGIKNHLDPKGILCPGKFHFND